MLVLGIESTCDDTCCAIVKDGDQILSNVISSQIEIHQEFGGVVPEIASRHHIEMMLPVIETACHQANIVLEDVDLIAVANEPGLLGSLLMGLHAAKGLALSLQKPFIGVNHIEAHLYAAIMSHPQKIQFPCLGVVLSGGHTAILLVKEIGKYQMIGHTIDDAIGEAFDKVAKMIDLPYPGGPQIEKMAQGIDPKHLFKAGQIKDSPFHFSFSGLKTAVLYAIQKDEISDKREIAAAFQEAAFQDVVKKTMRAAKEYGCQQIILGGGVTNSQYLRQLFDKQAPQLTCFWPGNNLSLDNAAMIAGLGYHKFKSSQGGDMFALEARPSGFMRI